MGTPIPEEPNSDNLILDPDLDDPTKWAAGGDWNIVGGEGVYVDTVPGGDPLLRNSTFLEPDKQYLVRVIMNNVDFDLADQIQLQLGTANFNLPHAAGTYDVIITDPSPGNPLIILIPLVAIQRGQTLNVQSIHVWSTVALDVSLFNIVAWRDQFFDNWDLGGAAAMAFYAGQRYQTRVWVKRA